MISTLARSLLGFFLVAVPAFADQTPDQAPANGITAKSAPYIGRDFCAALVIHPARIADSKLGQSVSFGELTMGLIKRTGVDLKPYAMLSHPEKIRRITVLAEGFPGGNVLFMPAAVIEFVEETDEKKLFPSMWPNGSFSKRDETIYETKARIAKTPLEATVLGPRTILIAPEFLMRKMLAKNPNSENPLLKQLEGVQGLHDVHFEYNSNPALSNILKLTGKTAAELRSDASTDDWIKMALLDLKSSSLSVNLNGKTILRGTVECSGLQAATQLKGIFDQGRKRLAPTAEGKKPPKDNPKVHKSKLAKLLEDLASETKIIRKAETLKFEVAMPQSLPAFLQHAAKEFTH